MEQNRRRSWRHTPTWQECLLVGGMIAACVYTVLPVLAQAADDEKARQTTCASNLKQLSIGVLSYSLDFDERLPPSIARAPQTWGGRIMPYIRSPQIFHCPDDPTTADTTLTPPAVPISYAENANLVRQHPSAPHDAASGIFIGELSMPSATVLFYEIAGDRVQLTQNDEGTHNYRIAPKSGLVSAAGTGLGSAPEWGDTSGKTSRLSNATGMLGGRPGTAPPPRHTGGSNFAATDGHVIWLKPGDVSCGRTNPSPSGAQDQPTGAAAGTSAVAQHFRLTFSPR